MPRGEVNKCCNDDADVAEPTKPTPQTLLPPEELGEDDVVDDVAKLVRVMLLLLLLLLFCLGDVGLLALASFCVAFCSPCSKIEAVALAGLLPASVNARQLSGELGGAP